MIRILLALLYLSFNLQAQELSECVEVGSSFPSLKHPDAQIFEKCRDVILNSSRFSSYKEYDEEGVIVFGHKNYIFAYVDAKSSHKKKQFPPSADVVMITGQNTRLEDVLSLDVDFKNKWIVVLAIEKETQKRAIFSYKLAHGGPVPPVRRFYTDELEDATSIRVNSENNKIYALYKNSGIVKSFNLGERTTGRYGHKFGKVQGSLEGPATVMAQVMDVAFDNKGHVYVLDAAAKRVYKFKENSFIGNVAPTSERTLSGGNGRYKRIYYNNKKGLLRVMDSDGTEIEVDL